MELAVRVEAHVVLAQGRVDEVLEEATEDDEDADVGGEGLLVVAILVEPEDIVELVEDATVKIGVVVTTELVLVFDMTD